MIVYDKVTPYEVYWCDLPLKGEYSIAGRRPVVVVSNEKECLFSPNVLVVPMTSTLKRTDLPCNIVCKIDNRDCVAMCNQLTVVPKTWLREYQGRLTPKEVREVQMGLLIELGFVG